MYRGRIKRCLQKSILLHIPRYLYCLTLRRLSSLISGPNCWRWSTQHYPATWTLPRTESSDQTERQGPDMEPNCRLESCLITNSLHCLQDKSQGHCFNIMIIYLNLHNDYIFISVKTILMCTISKMNV